MSQSSYHDPSFEDHDAETAWFEGHGEEDETEDGTGGGSIAWASIDTDAILRGLIQDTSLRQKIMGHYARVIARGHEFVDHLNAMSPSEVRAFLDSHSNSDHTTDNLSDGQQAPSWIDQLTDTNSDFSHGLDRHLTHTDTGSSDSSGNTQSLSARKRRRGGRRRR